MNKLFSGNNSRRDFVKGTSLLAGGILAAPYYPAPIFSPAQMIPLKLQ